MVCANARYCRPSDDGTPRLLLRILTLRAWVDRNPENAMVMVMGWQLLTGGELIAEAGGVRLQRRTELREGILGVLGARSQGCRCLMRAKMTEHEESSRPPRSL